MQLDIISSSLRYLVNHTTKKRCPSLRGCSIEITILADNDTCLDIPSIRSGIFRLRREEKRKGAVLDNWPKGFRKAKDSQDEKESDQ
jgi:hypothetical protein